MRNELSGGPRGLDLFCGIGGMSLGLQAAGLAVVGGVDHWSDAAMTYDRNLGHRCLLGDIATLEASAIEARSMCRFEKSTLSPEAPHVRGLVRWASEGADPRNGLWRAFRRLVAAIRPAYVVMENVEGMLVMEDGRVRDAVIAGFAEIGYRMRCRLLRAADYGVPQLRKRAIFLGWLDGLRPPEFPEALGSPAVTVGEAIFDLPPLESGQEATRYTTPPATEYQAARRKGVTELTNHKAASHPPTLVEVLRHVPDGGNRKSIPAALQPKSGFHNSYSRLASGKPAVAVTSNMRKPSSARATHPTQHRGLTVREGLRLQSFDDDFVVTGARTSQYLQVGNAVPPLLALAVGRQVVRAYQANTAREIEAARRRAVPLPKAFAQAGLFDLLEGHAG